MKNTDRAIFAVIFSFFYMSFAVGEESAQVLESIGPATYGDCVAMATNNDHNAVGRCAGDKSNTVVAWFRVKSTREVFILPPLASGKSCEALRMTERNKIYGKCITSSDVETAVVWDGLKPSEPPMALEPVSKDKSVIVTSVGQDFLVGQSFRKLAQKGQSTSVIWRFDSKTPTSISGTRDSCAPTSIKEARTGYSYITLICPEPITAKVAVKSPNTLKYVIKALTVPKGASQCTLGNTNESGQTLGTCHYLDGMLRTTYWSTIDGEPHVLKKDPDEKSVSVQLSNSGNALFIYQDSARHQHNALWNVQQDKVITISPLLQTSIVGTAGLANNNIVILNTRNASNVDQGAYLSPSLNTVGIGFYGGGKASYLEWINSIGTYAVGSAKGADGKRYAIGFSLAESDQPLPVLESGRVLIPPAVAP